PDTVHVCKTLDERPFRRRKQAALLTSLPIPPRYVKVGPRIGRYNTLRKVTPQGALQRTLRGHASPAFAKLAVASGQRPIHHCWSVNRKEACTVNDKSSLPASEAEWKARLGEDTWRVLRREGTEPPFSSELNDEHRQGTFVCAGCGAPLFESGAKFDSGTGWPSFFQPVEGAVETRRDFKLILPRTEYHCARCGGHQG